MGVVAIHENQDPMSINGAVHLKSLWGGHANKGIETQLWCGPGEWFKGGGVNAGGSVRGTLRRRVVVIVIGDKKFETRWP